MAAKQQRFEMQQRHLFLKASWRKWSQQQRIRKFERISQLFLAQRQRRQLQDALLHWQSRWQMHRHHEQMAVQFRMRTLFTRTFHCWRIRLEQQREERRRLAGARLLLQRRLLRRLLRRWRTRVLDIRRTVAKAPPPLRSITSPSAPPKLLPPWKSAAGAQPTSVSTQGSPAARWGEQQTTTTTFEAPAAAGTTPYVQSRAPVAQPPLLDVNPEHSLLPLHSAGQMEPSSAAPVSHSDTRNLEVRQPMVSAASVLSRDAGSASPASSTARLSKSISEADSPKSVIVAGAARNMSDMAAAEICRWRLKRAWSLWKDQQRRHVHLRAASNSLLATRRRLLMLACVQRWRQRTRDQRRREENAIAQRRNLATSPQQRKLARPRPLPPPSIAAPAERNQGATLYALRRVRDALPLRRALDSPIPLTPETASQASASTSVASDHPRLTRDKRIQLELRYRRVKEAGRRLLLEKTLGKWRTSARARQFLRMEEDSRRWLVRCVFGV